MLHVLGLAVLLALSSGIHAQNRTQQSDIHMVEGPGRAQRLIEGAGKEGTVALHASFDVKDFAPIIDALAEARAGRGEQQLPRKNM
jgi:hypothetical protein